MTQTSETSPNTRSPGFQRLDRWKRKLLDLSLRNRLINFRDIKKTIPLACPDVSALENLLSGGTDFTILPFPVGIEEQLSLELRASQAEKTSITVPQDTQQAITEAPNEPEQNEAKKIVDIPPVTGVDEKQALELKINEFLLQGMKNSKLYVKFDEKELNRRLLEIYRAARLSLEESGANTLFIALGFLSWYEADSSDQERKAPILLLPLEIERQSIKEGFKVSLTDQDPIINLTLLEKLKQDFRLETSQLEELPEDDSGLDINLIFQRFSDAVKSMGRWSVKCEAQIGIFSFTKFLMWVDLDQRSSQLMQNHVVRHLIETPNEQFDPKATFPDPKNLDISKSPLETYCPLDADSSQLCAVYSAQDGRTFVIEGPPGTGKSQTISNLVAHCLAHGKRVLFVAEKMAALDVVHNRLSKVGLDPFCLELHSNKARKQDVLKQLGASLEMAGSKPPSDWEQRANEVASVRENLNNFVAAIHKPRKNGESVFRATSRLIGLKDSYKVEIDFTRIQNLSADKVSKLRGILVNLPTVTAPVGDVASNELRSVGLENWNQSLIEEAEKSCSSVLDAVDKLIPELDKAANILGFSSNSGDIQQKFGKSDFYNLVDASRLMLEVPDPPINFPVEKDRKLVLEKMMGWIARGVKRDEVRRKLFSTYSESILNADLKKLLDQFESSIQGFVLIIWINGMTARKALKPYLKGSKFPSNEDIVTDLTSAIALKKETDLIGNSQNEPALFFKSHWNNGEPDWARLKKITQWAIDLNNLCERIRILNHESSKRIIDGLLQKVSSTAKPFTDEEYGTLKRTIDLITDFADRKDDLVELLHIDQARAWGNDSEPDYILKVKTTTAGIREKSQNLREWCFWRGKRKEIVSEGLESLITGFEDGKFTADQADDVFNRSYYEWWLDSVTKSDTVLNKFSSLDHQANIRNFKKLDKEYIDLTRRFIPAKLAAQVPLVQGDVSSSSEVGILMRQLQLKRRQMPLRKLISKIPNLLTRLKPCFLMSPLSVAQYFGVEMPMFDIIVFDEASQIPAWDAIGAIARGKDLIVVGDSKQLPPTTFFMRLEEGELALDDENDYEDLESILDECVAARLPRLYLGWHYRSRHESLITFSNYHYYENRLLTFPSPNKSTDMLGVSLRFIQNGVYDKGKSRTNRIEADAIVNEIITRLSNSETCTKSIGVVTFSIAQQTLVEDLLEDARKKYPDIDPYFTDSVPEPVFIKNLENVQGDERDIILLSVCYGPDEQGRITMSFGPLNREGGERRLNVAVTRSREQVIVFSSMHGSDIDLSRTQSTGAAHLRAFLDYAEKGPSSLASELIIKMDADFESPFENEVYERIVGLGYDADIQVGCSGYRIDIAVKDKTNPGKYILGIECDGANYHSASTARDRDRLRESVLATLGWTLHRVWSTDWWINPDKEVEKIKSAIEEAQKNKDRILTLGGGQNINIIVVQKEGARASLKDQGSLNSVTKSGIEVKKENSGLKVEMISLPGQETYKPYKSHGRTEKVVDLYIQSSVNHLCKLFVEIVEQEAPVHIEVAIKRLLDCWGLGRTTDKAKNYIIEISRKINMKDRPVQLGEFLWKPGQLPENYISFRVPGNDEASQRKSEEIPVEEIANAVFAILTQQIGLPIDDLAKETADILGFSRINDHILEKMKQGTKYLSQREKCVITNDRVTLPRK